MSDQPLEPRPLSPPKGWLWVARLTALVPVSAALVYAVMGPEPMWLVPCEGGLPFSIFLVILISPYTLCLKGLWGSKLKQGLAWGGVAGLFWGVLCFFGALGDLLNGNIASGLLTLFAWLTQFTLALSAVVMLKSLASVADQWRIIKPRIFLFVVYLLVVLLGAITVNPAARGRAADPTAHEGAALGSLWTIHGAQLSYRDAYGRGFSPTLRSLGPPAPRTLPSASAAGLIGEELAHGKIGRYSVRYSPRPADSSGRIEAYTVTAEPSNTSCPWRRFFTDESRVVRWTRENRPATLKDPVIE